MTIMCRMPMTLKPGLSMKTVYWRMMFWILVFLHRSPSREPWTKKLKGGLAIGPLVLITFRQASLTTYWYILNQSHCGH